MHVLHVISGIDPRDGGPVQALVGLATHQRAVGLDVTVLSSDRADFDPAAVEALRAGDVQVESIGPTRGPLLRHPDLTPAVARHVRAADVCHVHAVWGEIQHRAAVESRRTGTPYLVRPCGMLDPWCLAVGRLRKRLYLAWRLRRDLNAAAALHFTTEVERDLTAALHLRAPAIVEPNGVDLAEFDPRPESGVFRRRFPAVGDRPIVLFLSRVHPKKGLDLLIPAFARAETGRAVLVIAGPVDAVYRRELEAVAAASGLAPEDYVFTDMLRGEDRIAAFVDAELFVLPSYQENFGVAVVEALAAGCPVLISDQVNLHGAVSAAGVGGVVPAQVEPLAHEISRWMSEGGLRRAAAERAIPFVRERYDWAAIARRWPEHYRACSTMGACGTR